MERLAFELKKWLLDILVCPFCHGDISLVQCQCPGESDLRFLSCTECGAEHPIFLGRPLLVPRGREGVTMATDEAVGLKRSGRSAVEALAWLGEQQGSGKDLKELITWRSEPWGPYSRDEWIEILEGVRDEAVKRSMPQWWRRGKLKEALDHPLEPIPAERKDRSTSQEFACIAAGHHPTKLLDLASGSGAGICHILAHTDVKFSTAVERDLRCTWQLQYRIEHVSPSCRFEAVGADVRRLPFQDESFDFVTCYQGLGELCGISDFLAEVHRVLEPGGRFQVSFHNASMPSYLDHGLVGVDGLAKLFQRGVDYVKTNLPKLGKKEFGDFLVAADLFMDPYSFRKQVSRCGFRIMEYHLHPHKRPNPWFKENFILLASRG